MKPRCSESKKSIFFLPGGQRIDLTKEKEKRTRGISKMLVDAGADVASFLRTRGTRVHRLCTARDEKGHKTAICELMPHFLPTSSLSTGHRSRGRPSAVASFHIPDKLKDDRYSVRRRKFLAARYVGAQQFLFDLGFSNVAFCRTLVRRSGHDRLE